MFNSSICFCSSCDTEKPIDVTTLQGRSVNTGSGGACAILGKTLSRMDLVFCRWSLGEKCSATQGDFLVA